MSSPPTNPITATLAIASSCGHCPAVLDAMTRSVKAGELSELRVINIGEDIEFAKQHGIRSVPWFRIGEFVFDGMMPAAQITQWIQRAGDVNGAIQYLDTLLSSSKLQRAKTFVEANKANMSALMNLLGDNETSLNVRIGIGALIEELEGTTHLSSCVAELIALTQHDLAAIRADACHYLGLSHDPKVENTLRAALTDNDNDVREVASDTIENLLNRE
jgi:thioredoxin-like negative regulator of GroEL